MARWLFSFIAREFSGLDRLEKRTVLDEDAAAGIRALERLDEVGVTPQSLAVLFVRGEVREIDQGQGDVRRAREFGRQPVADELAAAAWNGLCHIARVALEVRALARLEAIADAERDHGAPSW